MAYVPPTIPEIIDIANISQYLASKDVAFDGIFNWGSLDKDLPLKIYDVREAVEWANGQSYFATRGIGSFLIQGTGSEGDIIVVQVDDPVYGLITIGAYELTANDTTTTLIASHVAASITSFGYSATSEGALVIVSAREDLYDKINGISVSVTYIPLVRIFDFTFDNTFN